MAKKSKIHILDDETINQIAAGEVVERPASVVKELVENAIDAGAEVIRVEIASTPGEITKIRVIDDGEGMNREDAALAFTRHATSKVNHIEDIHRITTMGFRGEALASIASVSRVTMITKPKGSDTLSGTKVSLSGGEILDISESASPDGTMVEISDLFFNTPARKKFLKSRQTEIAHTYGIMERIALSHPGISFRLVHNGAERMVTHSTDSLLTTIGYLFGNDLVKNLIHIEERFSYMQIDGYIAHPAITKPNSHQILIFINHRPVTHIPLVRSIKNGYGTLIPKDRYPFAFLNFNIDTALIDVNVHPTKKEVRLSREKDIIRDVTAAIANSLNNARLIPEEGTLGIHPSYHSKTDNERGEKMEVKSPGGAYTTFEPVSRHSDLSATDIQLRFTERKRTIAEQESRLPPMKILGQVDAAYIIAKSGIEGSESLFIIDQHAAHERVLYEQISLKKTREINSQELLIPVILTLRPREAELVRGSLHPLMTEGFLLEEFGNNTFAVRTVPVVLGKQVEHEVIEEIIGDLVAEEMKSSDKRKEEITTIIACRGAIKAGTVLTPEQMTRLVEQLRVTENPFTCPHGRPTLISLPRMRLDTLFKRT
jgi:DNA mismatch repair protein MutL